MLQIIIAIIGLFVVGVVSSIITWSYMDNRNKKRLALMPHVDVCPYKNACLRYDDFETREAIKRVVMLLRDNLETEEEYKKELYKHILSYGVKNKEDESLLPQLCGSCISKGSLVCLGSGGCKEVKVNI